MKQNQAVGENISWEKGRRTALSRSRLLREERGIALVIALLFLVSMIMLAIGTFFNSNTDIRISGNQKGTSQALYAAEAGIGDMVDKLNSDATYTPPTPYSTSWAPADLTGTVNGFSYTVRVRHKVDPTTGGIVFYDRSNYPLSPIPAGSANSYPVEVVSSTSSLGNYQNTTVLEVTKQKFSVQRTGALTAQSNVQLLGNITINGNPNDINGNPVAATPDCPALPSVATLTGKTVSSGGSATTTPAAVNNQPDSAQPDNPCEALGLPAGCDDGAGGSVLTPYVRAAADVQNPPMNKSIVWVQGNYATNCLSGTGLLIVHTPGFDPKKCDTSLPSYDATYCASHPPANLGNITGNCTFKGLVIADKINSLAGTGQIIGAVISFTDIQTDIVGAGTFRLNYSCAAIDAFVGGKVNQKLSWERQ
jgi:Tfp pilus assembly protein PilX